MEFKENSIKYPFSTHINEIIDKKPNWLIRYLAIPRFFKWA